MTSHPPKVFQSQPSYYAIIPANVRYDKNLEPNAKLLYGEISALSNIEGFCFSGNKYFADLYDVDIRTVKRWISALEKAGYIKIVHEKNGIRTLRKIYLFEVFQKMFTEGQKCPGVGDINVPPSIDNNTSVNVVCVDSPPVGASPPQKDHVKISVKTFQNSTIEVSKSELYTASIQKRKDWSSEEISEAWEILEKYQDPVRDWFKFCEGTIENLRKTKAMKKFKESKCQNTTNHTKPSINECGNSKVETSENDTWGLHLADWKSQLGQHKKSQNTSKNQKTS